MTWDYRTIIDGNVYSIREVYYDDNDEPYMTTEDGETCGNSIDELKTNSIECFKNSDDFHYMMLAFNRDTLNINNFPTDKTAEETMLGANGRE